jgi:hypothetical protein
MNFPVQILRVTEYYTSDTELDAKLPRLKLR